MSLSLKPRTAQGRERSRPSDRCPSSKETLTAECLSFDSVTIHSLLLNPTPKPPFLLVLAFMQTGENVGLYSKYREVHLAGRSRSFFRIDFMIFSVTWESGGNFHGHRGGVESQFQFLYPLGINHLRSLMITL